MPVEVQSNKVLINGTGSQLEFQFSFKIFKKENIEVKIVKPDGTEEAKILDTDYTVASEDFNLGGIVTFKTAPADTDKVLIMRSIPLEQDANFRPVSGFPEEVITDSFDAGIMIDQDLQEQINRCLRAPSFVSADYTLPKSEPGKALIWNEDGTKIVNSDDDVNGIVSESTKQAQIATEKANEASISAANAAASEANAKNSENLARDWAIKMDGKVNGEDYSSKYYANEAKVLTAGGLNQKQITNCILEAPKRINYEVINGLFTVKAGSQLIRPDGWIDKDQGQRKFTYETLDSDIALSEVPPSVNGIRAIFYAKEPQGGVSGLWYFTPGSNIYSQDTQPSSPVENSMWYDTNNNIIKHSDNTGATWLDEKICFPIALVLIKDGKVESVIDLFDISGFIGSCGWVNKSVKALFSDGRNEDYTLKNIEAATEDVVISSPTGYKNTTSNMFMTHTAGTTPSVGLGWGLKVYEEDVLPVANPGYNEFSLNKYENIWYFHARDTSKWIVSEIKPLIIRTCHFNDKGLIDTTSKNSVISLAKEQDLDGVWVNKNLVLANLISLTSSDVTFDLSDYLPKDGNIYEVLVSGNVQPLNTLNSYINLYVSSDVITKSIGICGNRTVVANTIPEGAGSAIIPVGAKRTLIRAGLSSPNAKGKYSLQVRGYRKVR